MTPSPSGSKQPPCDLAHHLTHQTRNWPTSALKSFYKFFQIPGIGQTAGGLPNPGYFPFDTLEAAVATPARFSTTRPDHAQPAASNPTTEHLRVPHASRETDLARKIDLETALQYGTADGYPPLHDWIRAFTRDQLHPNVPYAGGPDIVLTVGSTDGFSKCMQAMVEPWVEGRDPIERKQGILAEEYAYSMALTAAWPRGMNVAPVTIDHEGMCADGPGGLRDVLATWDYARGARPHLMYTVTMGHNPTGGVLSVKRRRALYAICQQYDVIIIEDDPYWYLQYPSAAKANVAAGRAPASPLHLDDEDRQGWASSGYPFLDSLVPSYLSLDTDGRVVRLDTFSKTIAPGCRLGWITAQPYFIERLTRITETSTQQPSGFVQSMVAQLLTGPHGQAQSRNAPHSHSWGVDGWVRWLEGLRAHYEQRMQAMCSTIDRGTYIVDAADVAADDWAVVQRTQVIDYHWPVGGMFVWLRVLYERHPLAAQVAGPKLAQGLFVHLTQKPYLVLASPGTPFGATPAVSADRAWQFFRLCFAAVEEDEVQPIAQRLVDGIHAFWRIRDPAVIDRLVDSIGDAAGAA